MYLDKKLITFISQCNLFVLEPYLLSKTLNSFKINELRWRFDLPEFNYTVGSLTLAMFANDKVNIIIIKFINTKKNQNSQITMDLDLSYRPNQINLKCDQSGRFN